ncbi:hypothetical protein GW884_00380 [Candidatus Falkowbacteria bacterium]|nr:hypothetical protein [Candidatus Falkowbacteria bacterium]
MTEIKSVNHRSLANITALIYGLVGFFIALIVAISTMANIVLQKDFAGSVILVTLFNVGAGLLLGIITAFFTAAIGWVFGFISAGLYNWFAKKIGGVKVELTEAEEAIKEATEEAIEGDNNPVNNY